MYPRIYTYRITFEEVPYYYYGVHKEKKYDEIYWGSPYTNKWCWEFYTPKKQILEVFEYTDDGWITAQQTEKRIIKAFISKDIWCLNRNCAGIISSEVLRKHATGRKHQVGKLNSQYGKMWITDGIHSYSINKTDTIPEGYRKGRAIGYRKGRAIGYRKGRDIQSIQKTNTCVDCGCNIHIQSVRCRPCSLISLRKFEISKDDLSALITKYPMTKIGEMLGVSDNAVRKRCRLFGLL